MCPFEHLHRGLVHQVPRFPACPSEHSARAYSEVLVLLTFYLDFCLSFFFFAEFVYVGTILRLAEAVVVVVEEVVEEVVEDVDIFPFTPF